MQVGLGHDLDKRRPAAIEVDDAAVRAVDPTAGPQVHELCGVLLEVHAVDPDFAKPPSPAQRDVVLRYLIALREIRVEVVLAVEL